MNYSTVITDRDTWFFRSSTSFFQIYVNGLSGTDGVIVLNGVNINDFINSIYSFTSSISSVSGNWQDTYTTVYSNSAFWESVYSTVQTNSALWEESTDITYLSGRIDFNTNQITQIGVVSGDWTSTYLTVQANSAINWNYQGTDLKELSSNWQDTFLLVQANSSTTWLGNSAVDTLVYNNSSIWNEAYTNINTNSAAYLSTISLGDIPALSSNWNSTYTTVQENSATTWLGDSAVDSLVHNNSAYWNSVYTTVTLNSATTWLGDSAVDMLVHESSATWNNTYTVVNTNSADWITASQSISSYAYFSIENPLGFAYGDIKHIFVPLGINITKVRVLSYWGTSSISLCWLDTVFSANGDQTFDVSQTVTVFPQRLEFLTSGSNGVFLQFR